MRAILTLLLLVGIASSATAQMVTNGTARFKTLVTCKTGSSLTATGNPSPANTSIGFESKDVGTTPGREYELAWKLVGKKGDKDVYHFTFTRVTKAGVRDKTTSSKEVEFEGKRVVVFGDELHLVVMDVPTDGKLK